MSAVCLGSCLSTVAIEVKLAYSYSVTCSNNQFCRNCKYYEFETVSTLWRDDNSQSKNGPRVASSPARTRLGPEWRSLVNLGGLEKHNYSTALSENKRKRYSMALFSINFHETSFVAIVSTECYWFGYRPLGAYWGFSTLARSRTSYHCRRPIQLSQWWAV